MNPLWSQNDHKVNPNWTCSMDVLVIGYPLLSMHIRNPRRFVVDIKHSWACIVLEKRGHPWIGGWGEIVRASTPLEQGNRFGSVVRACARCLSCQLGRKMRSRGCIFYLFSREVVSFIPWKYFIFDVEAKVSMKSKWSRSDFESNIEMNPKVTSKWGWTWIQNCNRSDIEHEVERAIEVNPKVKSKWIRSEGERNIEVNLKVKSKWHRKCTRSEFEDWIEVNPEVNLKVQSKWLRKWIRSELESQFEVTSKVRSKWNQK